ncbi:MAG: FAD-dependent oxidoreductase [Alicyclobacillus sp.]|nr:FAD-dependent oxidoreductase [Alicyclobacillus sp.]
MQEVHTDICVVGAGMAGVMAALEAARLGRRVALVDSLPALGGQAVNAIVGTFCGLFANGTHGIQFTHGLVDNLLHDLELAGALHWRRGPMTTVVMYDEVALSRWIEHAVHTAGITVLMGAVLRGVERQGRRVESVELATRFGDVRLRANGFVDASGDAALTWHAGLPCREPADGRIYGTQMMVLEGVVLDHVPTQAQIAEQLRAHGEAFGLIRQDGFTFAFPVRGTALVNMTHIETPLDPVASSAVALAGKEQADRVVRFLKETFPDAFAASRVRSYGLPGVRQTRWIVGRYQLTVDDVRSGTRFPDAVARTAWPIELHDKAEGYVWEPFSEDHVHYVPLRSMLPPDVDNVVVAGRCIDADVAALSSVRVHGPCMAMGMAAAHALDLAGDHSVHDISWDALRRRLADNVERKD